MHRADILRFAARFLSNGSFRIGKWKYTPETDLRSYSEERLGHLWRHCRDGFRTIKIMKRFEFCFGVLDFEGNNECRPRYFLHSKRRTQVLFLFSMRIFHPLDLFILAMDFGPWVTYIAISYSQAFFHQRFFSLGFTPTALVGLKVGDAAPRPVLCSWTNQPKTRSRSRHEEETPCTREKM